MRANSELQLITERQACIQYLVKYASKVKGCSSVEREALVQVMNHKTKATSAIIIKTLTNTYIGEKVIGGQKVLHKMLVLNYIAFHVVL